MNFTTEKPIHFLVRVPQITRLEGSTIDTVRAHSDVYSRLGSASVAKFGMQPASHNIERLKKQIKAGIRTCLILVVREADGNRKRYLPYEANMSAIHLGAPTAQIKKTSPSYYEELGYAAGTWFTISSPFVAKNLESFRIAKTGKKLSDVLKNARAAAMFVERIGAQAWRRDRRGDPDAPAPLMTALGTMDRHTH
jgi:hypothetical protein